MTHARLFVQFFQPKPIKALTFLRIHIFCICLLILSQMRSFSIFFAKTGFFTSFFPLILGEKYVYYILLAASLNPPIAYFTYFATCYACTYVRTYVVTASSLLEDKHSPKFAFAIKVTMDHCNFQISQI